MKDNSIKNRKIEHLDIFGTKDVQFQKTSGFEYFRLIHNSLPEQNFDKIDIRQDFFGYKLSMPFLINAITGGMEIGEKLNSQLSEIANRNKIAFALGSMRPCFNKKEAIKSFSKISNTTEGIPVIGNLGGQQLLEYSTNQIENVIGEVKIDAMQIHLNPLQEALQPDGDKNFIGITEKILDIAEVLSKPIIVKEVGFGLPVKNIIELSKSGIEWFDIAGAGGTSWAKVEKHRNRSEVDFQIAQEFDEFGIPTAELLQKVVDMENVNIIASGGINRAMDFAKAIAMGAKICGSAGKILENWNFGGSDAVERMLQVYKETLKIAVFITGCKNLIEFREIENIDRCSNN